MEKMEVIFCINVLFEDQGRLNVNLCIFIAANNLNILTVRKYYLDIYISFCGHAFHSHSFLGLYLH